MSNERSNIYMEDECDEGHTDHQRKRTMKVSDTKNHYNVPPSLDYQAFLCTVTASISPSLSYPILSVWASSA